RRTSRGSKGSTSRAMLAEPVNSQTLQVPKLSLGRERWKRLEVGGWELTRGASRTFQDAPHITMGQHHRRLALERFVVPPREQIARLGRPKEAPALFEQRAPVR